MVVFIVCINPNTIHSDPSFKYLPIKFKRVFIKISPGVWEARKMEKGSGTALCIYFHEKFRVLDGEAGVWLPRKENSRVGKSNKFR